MSVLCLGPCCIPVSAFLPLLLFFISPILNLLRKTPLGTIHLSGSSPQVSYICAVPALGTTQYSCSYKHKYSFINVIVLSSATARRFPHEYYAARARPARVLACFGRLNQRTIRAVYSSIQHTHTTTSQTGNTWRYRIHSRNSGAMRLIAPTNPDPPYQAYTRHLDLCIDLALHRKVELTGDVCT